MWLQSKSHKLVHYFNQLCCLLSWLKGACLRICQRNRNRFCYLILILFFSITKFGDWSWIILFSSLTRISHHTRILSSFPLLCSLCPDSNMVSMAKLSLPVSRFSLKSIPIPKHSSSLLPTSRLSSKSLLISKYSSSLLPVSKSSPRNGDGLFASKGDEHWPFHVPKPCDYEINRIIKYVRYLFLMILFVFITF